MKNKGFTLVELLVVIVIIGILAAAAISVFGGGTDKAKLNTVKNDVAAFHSAGTLAIADQGWSNSRNISKLVTEGYLSEVSINPYWTSTLSQPFYAYAASKVESGQTTNPVVLSGGYIDGGVFTKGGTDSFAVSYVAGTYAFSQFEGNPQAGTYNNWTSVAP